ncbi:MAG: sugar ABC transporter substrate-binding protein [Bacillota bacterium]|jgi:ABC-type glycerol-3-phosphate transport system substrate-binding protein
MKLWKAVLLMLLGGCVLTPTFAAPKQITLSVLYDYSNEGSKACINQLLKQYKKLHPGIKLNVQVVPQGKWSEIMRLRALANDYPDVTICPIQRVGEWAMAGKLAAGNQYIPASVLNKYHKARLASVTYNSGQIYGLPVNNTVRSVAYNVDYFAKAGITPPQRAEDAWTWAELVAAARKVQAASGAKYALQFDRPNFEQMLPFIYQAGGQLMSDDYTRSTLNTPPVRKALEWVVKLHRDGIAAPGVIEGLENPVRLFASGMTTMWLAMGNWMMNALEAQTKYKYSYTFMPQDVQEATGISGKDWIVCKGAHPKEAWDLLLYLVSPGPMASFCEVSNTVPPRSDVQVTWKLHPELAPFFTAQAQECPEALMKQQIHPAFGACRDKLLQELSMCVSGQKSVDAALVAMDRIMGDAMKKYHY